MIFVPVIVTDTDKWMKILIYVISFIKYVSEYINIWAIALDVVSLCLLSIGSEDFQAVATTLQLHALLFLDKNHS